MKQVFRPSFRARPGLATLCFIANFSFLATACPFRSGYGVDEISSIEGLTTIGEDWNPGPGGLEREFLGIMEAAREIYPYFGKKGIDPDALEAEFLSRLGSLGQDPGAGPFLSLMQEFFARLGNGHSGLCNLEWSAADARAILLSDGVFVDRFSGAIGPSRGDRILAIDGLPVEEWLASRRISASTPQWRKFSALEEVFQRWFWEGDSRSFRFERPDSSAYDAEIALTGRGDGSVREGVESRVLGTAGYIAVNAMKLGLEDTFELELEKNLDRPALVIDLRENHGGDSRVGDRIMSHFLKGFYRGCLGQAIWPDWGLSYEGKVAVLVGAGTFSAAESFACDLQGSGCALAVGRASGGDTGSAPRLFLTEGGILFRLASDRDAIEGTGVLPDVSAEADSTAWFAGEDPVLERALEVLGVP